MTSEVAATPVDAIEVPEVSLPVQVQAPVSSSRTFWESQLPHTKRELVGAILGLALMGGGFAAIATHTSVDPSSNPAPAVSQSNHEPSTSTGR